MKLTNVSYLLCIRVYNTFVIYIYIYTTTCNDMVVNYTVVSKKKPTSSTVNVE